MNFFKLLEIKGVGGFFVPDSMELSKTADVMLGKTIWHADLYVLLMLALVIAISHFTYRWIEMPGREWAKRIIKRRRAARAAALQVTQ